MKRFYKSVTTEQLETGHAIRLDGRAVKTPARAELVLPTSALGLSVAAEWDAQEDDIDPRSMPLTGLANAAIDHVAPDPAAFAKTLDVYGETDLVCYRAEHPAELVGLQAECWDPLIDWAQQRYDIEFEIIHGIMHQPQPRETVARLAAAVHGFDSFQLAALQPLITISGSLVITLALAEGEIDGRAAFDAAHLDELWQAEQWGEDELATKARAHRADDFRAAARFLALLV
ncbi:MAG: ATP12 family protein [Rhizorhabdus sp.]